MMDMCPSPYDTNCRWKDIKCSICKGNDADKEKLYYSPLSKTLPLASHPSFIEDLAKRKREKIQESIDKKSSNSYKRGKTNNRLGKKEEQKAMKDIGAKMTVASGSICGDGDAYINVRDMKLQIEHKLRIGTSNRLSVTKSEWDKGKKQGIDLFVISSDEQRIVIMDADLFKTLMEMIDE